MRARPQTTLHDRGGNACAHCSSSPRGSDDGIGAAAEAADDYVVILLAGGGGRVRTHNNNIMIL